MRHLSKRAVLYTEMVNAHAVLRGDRARLLAFPAMQHPLVLQLGGSDPALLSQAARIGEEFGYDEINLNVGCPSDRVQSGKFGAALMKEPGHTADLVAAMQAAVRIPVTVKCRIGVDDQDAEEDFNHFIDLVAAAGCSHFIVHARKAWLKGLSPKENRDVPPLDYRRVYRLKKRRQDLQITINGGIGSLDQAEQHLQNVDGVMIGRAACHNPYMLARVDERLYGAGEVLPTRAQIVTRMLPYIEEQLAEGVRLNRITRVMAGLYLGEPGARQWRRMLGENACAREAGANVVREALSMIEQIRERAA